MRTEAAARSAPAIDASRRGPIFIAGADRSGTTLLFALLASHPNISMSRRTNMWRYFHERYGDLADPENLDRCLRDMLRYKRMRHLHPDADRIHREFLEGGALTYGRLFSLFHEHLAASGGKARWGDKSLHTERYADRVFAEYPNARIVQILRDPRDRYASVRKRHGDDVPRVGAATGRWLVSTRLGRRNRTRYPDRYLLVRYEDLARDPEPTLRRICEFIGEPYTPEMLLMRGAQSHADDGGNSSFGDFDSGTISTKAIGRYRTVLTPSEMRFIDLVAGRDMSSLGYPREAPESAPGARARFLATFLPNQLARMFVEVASIRVGVWKGVRRPAFRFADEPIEEGSDEA